MENLSYCSVALGSVNSGEIKRDGEYFFMCLGALNIFNSAGKFYDYEASKSAFDNGTAFKRTMLAGNMYGEDNHPMMESWMSEEQFLIRNEQIDVSRRSVLVRDIEFIPNGKLCNGQPVMEIWGWIKPFGDKGPQLLSAILDPHQNVCFSIRAWVVEKWVNGVKWLKIDEPICFDWVPEPGISIASKFYAEHGHKITNENLPRELVFESHSIKITNAMLARVAIANENSTGRKLATESYLANKLKTIKSNAVGINIKKGGLADTNWRH